ncbi:MAG TPA: 8-oxoguanine deaminase [Anaerolineaceae bacterium]|nr:8-oxoguanine deaminase [Anaerolineaceae bacterium]HNZ00030.1 8-oxoguanine deaminase [Anaerolineaceae bacterium]HOH19220.1 8-oxoguanine deaminase [Anaerolineaceae bacterium]HQF44496.1 8-oxoguanine deaminase [Anaerolineaceae bacterium]HQH34383.1 8-oxoguanine deaminase [Anaerolineaceae bacterium]
MSTLLVKNASLLVTMDDQRREIRDGGLFIRDGFIQQVGETADLPYHADEVIDLRDHIVLPGLINTHHHFYQTLTRAVPAAQNANLFNWLTTLYPIWARITPDEIFISTQTALAELALSGCTTASDHLYLYPNGSRLDDEIDAAREVGLRIHASRGSMSLGQSQGGLPPDSVVESEDRILADSVRLIERYHDPSPGAFVQIVLAPCSPFSVTGELMRQSAILARHYGVHLHTHLAETQDEEIFCQEKFGYRPVGYMQSVDWVGEDVWFAHSVYVSRDEINLYAKTGCGVAHCPSSNMRLASGIAPIRELMAAGVKVGIGVDGSASNDGSHLLAEARMAMLMDRLRAGVEGASLSSENAPALMTGRQALELATRGGAAVLGRKDLGSLETGKCADFVAINLNRLDYAGALHDPVSAVVFCAPRGVDWNVVHGRVIVRNGHLETLDVPRLVERHNRAARRLVSE